MMKFIHKTYFRMLLTALCIILLSCVMALSFIGVKSAKALNALPTTTSVEKPLYNYDLYCYEQEALDQLATLILKKSNSVFKDLLNYANNTAGTKGLPIDNKELTLKYGHYRYSMQNIWSDFYWMPVYISSTASGHAVLTLYLASTSSSMASSQEKDYFSSSGSYSTNTSNAAPSNSYGTSHMRANTLGNGSENGANYAYYPDYITNKNSVNSKLYPATIQETECNKFSEFVKGDDFTGLLYDDIVTPSQMEWQARESSVEYLADTAYGTYCWPNEAYSEQGPSSGAYYLPTYFDYNAKSKTNYNIWQYDKVWLPSLTEVGTGDDGLAGNTLNGIWQLNASQRSNNNFEKSWLRTAATNINKTSQYSTYTMFCNSGDGKTVTTADVNEICAVRPCIHLDLTQIATKTTPPVNLPETISVTYDGESYKNLERVPSADIPWYDPSIMTINFFTDETCLHPATAVLDADTYYVMVTLFNTDKTFLGGSTAPKSAKFVVEKVKLSVDWEYDTDGTPSRVFFTNPDAIYERDLQSGREPKLGMKYSSVTGAGIVNSVEFPDKRGTYKATAYIIDEELYNYNYSLSTTGLVSNSFLVKQKKIDIPYFLDEDNVNSSGELILNYSGRSFIQIGNVASKYVKITLTATDASALDNVKDMGVNSEGVQTYTVENVTDYTFTISLIDKVNTMWSTGTDENPDTQDVPLKLRLNKAKLTANFTGLLSTWETNSDMKFSIDVQGLYEELGSENGVSMAVSYLTPLGASVDLTPDSAGIYTILKGQRVGTYIVTVQLARDSSYNSNYVMEAVQQKCTIVENVGKFEDSDAIWQYKTSGSQDATEITTVHGSASTAFEVPYTGEFYQFTLTLPESSLTARYVRAVYTGDTYVSDAGSYSVTVTITAFDKNVTFTDKTYTIYFKIVKAKFDLSGVKWNYSGAFTYNGEEQKAILLPETVPSGLTAEYRYVLDGKSTTSTVNGGSYKTTVSFHVSPDLANNYNVPSAYDSNSFIGDFDFTIEWEIKAQTIYIKWNNTQPESSSVVYTPTIQIGHSYVDYTYEKQSGSNWVACERSAVYADTTDVTFRVTATVNSLYSSNFILAVTPGDTVNTNPFVFTVSSGKQAVTIHLEINGVKCEDGDSFAYTGKPFSISPVIDSGNLEINTYKVEYYSVYANGQKGDLLSGSPINVGKYIATVSINYAGAYASSDSQTEVLFEIKKGDFDVSQIKWQYVHGDVTRTARYDVDQHKWVNEDGEEVIFSFEYDGTEHVLTLISDVEGLTVAALSGNKNTNASETAYTAYASFDWDDENYNMPVFPALTWYINKARINIENVKWGYIDSEGVEHEFDFENDTFYYTRNENGAVSYTVGLIGLSGYPEEIQNLFNYKTTPKTVVGAGQESKNTYSAVGVYETVLEAYASCSLPNYQTFNALTDLPSTILRTQIWEIANRELTSIPDDEVNIVFDDKVHDILEICGIPEDELYYFDIEIIFIDTENNVYNYYRGYQPAGADLIPYSAYQAGTYIVRFNVIKTKAVFDSSNRYTGEYADEAYFWDEVTINIGKHEIIVTWDMQGSVPVARVSGLYGSDMIGTLYTNENGGKVDLESILAAESGELFYAQPYVLPAYSNNLTYIMASGDTEKFSFYSEKFVSNDDTQKLSYPSMVNPSYEYTGEPIDFKIGSWDGYYNRFLYIADGSLTQTEVGVYYILLSFIKDANAVWNTTTTNDRSAYKLKFEITPQSARPIEYPKFKNDISTAVYTGSPITFEITNWLILQEYIEITSGSLTATNAGVYTVVFSFKEGSIGYWAEDPENPKKTYRLQYEIIDPSNPEKTIQLTYPELVVDEKNWNGGEIVFEIYEWDYYSEYLEISNGSLSHTTAGTYEVTLSVKDGVNAVFADGSKSITLSFKIVAPVDPGEEFELEKPVLTFDSAYYQGKAIEFIIKDWDSLYSIYLEITEGSLVNTDINEYSVTLSFKEGTKATWLDGSRDPYTLTYSIVDPPRTEPERLPQPKIVVVSQEYTGDYIGFTIENWDNLSKYVAIDAGIGYLIQKEVGEYSFYLQIKDKTVAVWDSNGTTDDLLLSFSIKPATLSLDNIQIGEDGKISATNSASQNVNFDDFFEYKYYDKDGNEVPVDELVDGEEYTVKLTLKDGKEQEFKDSFTNSDEILQSLTSQDYKFVYKSGKGGITPILIITIAVVGVLVFLVVVTIVVLAAKRSQYTNKEIEVYDDYEEDDV